VCSGSTARRSARTTPGRRSAGEASGAEDATVQVGGLSPALPHLLYGGLIYGGQGLLRLQYWYFPALIIFAALIVAFLETPIERWRHRALLPRLRPQKSSASDDLWELLPRAPNRMVAAHAR